MASPPTVEHVDVLIVGAGLSGIGAAWHLEHERPGTSYAILEAREAIGGTWDLFRYPGVRSDSDLSTFAYGFRPWTGAKAIADGPEILEYLRATVRDAGIDAHIRLGHRVVGAAWSSADARWTVDAERADTGETVTLTAGWLFCASGYFRYDEGFRPELPGIDAFGGEVVHPQHWPEDLDVAGRRVVVIGSGATAVTLVPALAAEGARVTMLQRSPTYIASLPSVDPFAEWARRVLPERLAFPTVRWKNILQQIALYQLSRRRPGTMKRLLRKVLDAELPAGYDIDRHFSPRYDPWDQRLCLVPDGDLFRAIRAGTASVVTGEIEAFGERGIRLRSGEELEADVVVTATGLNLLMFGGIELEVDGRPVALPTRMTYKGMMLEGVPNFAFAMGYTNSSWTLKADLTGEYVGRLLAHMDRHGHTVCVPRNADPTVERRPLLDFGAGYVLRSLASLPKSGSKAPWKLRMNYAADVVALRFGPVDDGVMSFSAADPAARPAPLAAAA